MKKVNDFIVPMLQNTFCHIEGITQEIEVQIWKSGLQTWNQCIKRKIKPSVLEECDDLKEQILNSFDKLFNHNAQFFSSRLPSNLHWRLFPEFRSTLAYIDIETTGFGSSDDYITTIALYDGTKILYYINGENLDEFKRDIRRYKIIVTYNGKCFDVPFIRRYLGLSLEQVHIDLRYVLKNIGYTGGLKACESQFHLSRGELNDIDGYFAVLLWYEYKRRRNSKALETLLAYNIKDVMTLEVLLTKAYNKNLVGTPFKDINKLARPSQPVSPFKADRETIEKIKRENDWI